MTTGGSPLHRESGPQLAAFAKKAAIVAFLRNPPDV